MKRLNKKIFGHWLKIASLPFVFFASELVDWTRDELALIFKIHRIMMMMIFTFSFLLIGAGMLSVQKERIDEVEKRVEERIGDVKRVIEKGDLRIDLVQQQVNDINIQVTKIVSSVDSLTTNLVWGLRILGGMALVLLGQFAAYVFGVKMQRELSRVGGTRK